MNHMGAFAGVCLAIMILFMTGCDSSSSGATDEDLDGMLSELLTNGGQRTAANFILPGSTDLASLPQDPLNPLTPQKVELGKLLFHDTALSTNPRHDLGLGTYGCVTCHHADAGFQAGRVQALGDGGAGWGQKGEGRHANAEYSSGEIDAPGIRSPTVLHAGFQQVMAWSGGFGAHGQNTGTDVVWTPDSDYFVNNLGYEGAESQAIAALSVHRMNRVKTSVVASNPIYIDLWSQVFPGQEVSVEKVGLALAAYERTLVADKAPFQRWLRGQRSAMTDAQKRGAIVFFGKADCESCHTGPSLNSVNFYALGMPDMQGPNVLGNPEERLGRGGFLDDPEQYYQFKIPQLYNLKDSPFLGHGGTFRSVREVVEYYNDGVPERTLPAGRLERRFKPLQLSERQVSDLTEFIRDALYDSDLARYVPDSVPSGNCFPANDPESRADLGCE